MNEISNYNYSLIERNGEEMLNKNIFTPIVSILKCVSGNSTIIKNLQKYYWDTDTFVLITDFTNIKVIECSDDFKVIECRLSLSFFSEFLPYLDNKVWNNIEYNYPMLFDANENYVLNTIFEQICLIKKLQIVKYEDRIIINNIINYMYYTSEFVSKHISSIKFNEISKYSNNLLDDFYVLCDQFHISERTSKFYAEKLFISERQLYNIVKKATNYSPKQVIDFHVCGSIKKLLLTTNLSNQQISDKMNFPDQSTLGQFFKRNTGLSPLHYQKKYK